MTVTLNCIFVCVCVCVCVCHTYRQEERWQLTLPNKPFENFISCNRQGGSEFTDKIKHDNTKRIPLENIREKIILDVKRKNSNCNIGYAPIQW